MKECISEYIRVVLIWMRFTKGDRMHASVFACKIMFRYAVFHLCLNQLPSEQNDWWLLPTQTSLFYGEIWIAKLEPLHFLYSRSNSGIATLILGAPFLGYWTYQPFGPSASVYWINSFSETTAATQRTSQRRKTSQPQTQGGKPSSKLLRTGGLKVPINGGCLQLVEEDRATELCCGQLVAEETDCAK